jgi:predicted flap endonuclease-1-like 5' DNA nuclease
MTKTDLPSDSSPLSPVAYWQESLQAWADFSQSAGKIILGQIGNTSRTPSQKLEANADTLASEILRTYSDLNLRHWQNTARLLEGLPAWAKVPNSMAGSSLVDWFDTFQRKTGQAEPIKGAVTEPVAPERLKAPDGSADDLTRIKGIGPKLLSRLNAIGIYHFRQIAKWSDADIRWVEATLARQGRVTRDAWVEQARRLVANGAAALH